MEESDSSNYWCHMCSQTVNPIIEIETIKCPICQSGFVEEMATEATPENVDRELGGGSDPDRALSLWAPILLGMMTNPNRRRRLRRIEFNNESGNDDEGDTELDRELESIRRRRRSSATILHLLQGIRAGISYLENPERASENQDGDRLILINPFNQTMIVDSQNRAPLTSLGDYFMGPGLDLLLQHLSENDPNRYGTPPAQKEAVEALPNVKTKETIQCSVCLDDCEIGSEVKEMPCKHKFHSACILPWLELHSSCPVCRFQLPFDESKIDSEGLVNNSSRDSQNDSGIGDEEGNDNGRRFSIPILWPFSSLFSGSQSSNGNSSGTSPSRESRDGPRE